ncbi:MAG: TonB-dependent receptor [Caulobacteraceae bacterium]|nr:TonB-dependent receptor [Caulobacteraceae bacterium]
MTRHLLAGAAFGALVFGMASGVMAQAAPAGQAAAASAATPAAGPGSASVSEIVVTAERRSESVQKVDISMTVLGHSQLVQQNILTVNDLQNASPNLQVEPAFGSGQPEFRIRGVGFQDYASNNSPTVGIYINDVAYPIPVMTQNAFFDIQRVEVLRGPQGTLYGRNTTGGAVNIYTNQPTSTFTAGAEVEYGSYSWLHAETYISGPITDNLTSRFAFLTEQGGAYQFNRDTGNSFGNAHRFGFRSITEWTPISQLDIKLELHGFIDNSDGQGLYLFTPANDGSGFTAPADKNHYATGWDLDPTFARFIGAPPHASPFRQNVQDGGSLNIKYDLGFAQLDNIFSYDFMNRREFEDWGAVPQEVADTFFHTRSTVIADELRLVSKDTGPLTWIAGLYVSYQNQNEAYLSDFLDIYGISAGVHYNQHVNSEAAFGQLDYKITDTVKLIAGLRFEDEHRYLDNFTSQFLFGTTPIAGLPPSNVTQSMTPVTGKVGIEYTPSEDLMFYGTVSRGVKSGGFTTYNTANVQGISAFQPEKLWAFETGYKYTLLRNLRFDGDIFYYDYQDQQILSALFTPGVNGQPPTIIGHFVNAPRSHIEGGEVSLEGELAPHLMISEQLGYAIGHYDNFKEFNLAAYEETGATGISDLSGASMPFPKLSYQGSISYWFWIAPEWKLQPEMDYSYHGNYPSWLGSIYTIPPYWLANLNLTLTPPGGKWTAALWIHNLFNKEYDLTRNFFVPGVNVADPGPPRMIGGRLTYAF